MGNDITLPVEMKPDLGMFCISLRPFHKIELIHAPPVVVACVRRVANEVNGAGLHARSLLVHLFAAAVNLGFQIVASADVSSKYAPDSNGQPGYPLDVHSIYLVKMPMQT